MKTLYFLSALGLSVGFALSAQAQDAAAGQAKFGQLCSTCHGQGAAGDGPAAPGLRPSPANMTTAEWQSSVDDEYLRDIITRGGAAVGKSPMMASWGHALKGEDLDSVIAFIRSVGPEG